MANVYYRWGAMSCGKSEQVIGVYNNYVVQGKKALVLTPATDNRHGVGRVTSRNGNSIDAMVVHETDDIVQLVQDYIKAFGHLNAVIVDEAQFFKKHHVLEMCKVADDLDIPVLAYGLLSDFKGELFEGSYHLIVHANKKEELKTECWYCARKAMYNMRVDEKGNKIADGEQIQVGGTESYKPACRKHYFNPIKFD